MDELQYVYIISCIRAGLEYKNSYKKLQGRKHQGLFYKIGRTNNLVSRLSEIQTCCPFELRLFFWARFKNKNSAINAEQEMHLKYKESCIRGEWFFFANVRGLPQTLHKVKVFLARLNNTVEISENLKSIVNKTHYTNKEIQYFISTQKRKNSRERSILITPRIVDKIIN